MEEPTLEMEEPDSYMDVAQWRLVMYALATLEYEQKETSIDDIAVRCFNIFPKKFSMLGYPEYPDQMRVGRELQRAYSFGMVKERNRKVTDKHKRTKSYKLTEKGQNELSDIKGKVEAPLDPRRVRDNRDKDEAIIKKIENHPLYKQYIERKRCDVKDYLFKNLLFLTLDADEKDVSKALERIKTVCRLSSRNDLIDFIVYCEEHRQRGH